MNDLEIFYEDAYARNSLINSYVDDTECFDDLSWTEEFEYDLNELIKEY